MPSQKTSPLCGILTPQQLDSQGEWQTEIQADCALCGFLEIRFDLFSDPQHWPSLLAKARQLNPEAQTIATIRLESDGGAFPNRRASARAALFDELSAIQRPDWIDWELDNTEDLAQLKQALGSRMPKLLLSRHDFKSVPSENVLDSNAAEALVLGAQGIKWAVTAQSAKDLNALDAFCMRWTGRFSVLACFSMGSFGSKSRYSTLSLGANLTYAPFGSQTVAPGQIPLRELHQAIAGIQT